MAKTIQMTKGPIARNMIFFILPLIGSGLCQQLYNTADFLFVSNLLGKTAAAAVGASSTIVTCTIGLFSGIAIGAEVTLATALGAGQTQKADKIMHTALLFAALGGVALMGLGILFAPQILRLLDTPESIMELAVLYIRIYFLSIPASILYNMCAGVMRACGDSSTPFRILTAFGVVNVAGDALLMAIVPLGVAGAAIATVFCYWCAAALMLRALHSGAYRVSFSWQSLRMDRNSLRQILWIGLPAGIQTVVITLSNIVVQYYINGFGELAVAAFSAYYKVENFIYLPIMAFGQAATTFSSQNTGTGDFSRIRRGTVIAAGLGVAVTLGISGGILLFSETVIGWFMKDPETLSAAIMIAFVSYPFYWLYPIMEVLGGSLRGMGYAAHSMAIVLFNLCGVRIILLALFTRYFHTLRSVASVYPITWALATAFFIILFLWVLQNKLRSQ